MEGMEEGSLFTLSWPTMLKATDVPIVRRPSYRRKISAITVRLWRRILPNASKRSRSNRANLKNDAASWRRVTQPMHGS